MSPPLACHMVWNPTIRNLCSWVLKILNVFSYLNINIHDCNNLAFISKVKVNMLILN